MTLCATTFDTVLGQIGVAATEDGLCRVAFWTERDARAEEVVSQSENADESDFLALAIDQLRAYLEGERQAFDVPLDLSAGTAFQREVWRVTADIPYGEARTYGDVAKMIGRAGASRAVGQALTRNPVPIFVPCHRVVAADGSLGGFGAGRNNEHGLRLKRSLLAIEGHPLGDELATDMLPGLGEHFR